jgi:hypothetical protein
VNVDLTPEEWKILFQETQQTLELEKVQEEELQSQEIKRVMFGRPKHAASTIDTELAEPPKGSPKKRKRGCKSTQKAIMFAYSAPSQPPPESVFIDIVKNESAPKITIISTTKLDQKNAVSQDEPLILPQRQILQPLEGTAPVIPDDHSLFSFSITSSQDSTSSQRTVEEDSYSRDVQASAVIATSPVSPSIEIISLSFPLRIETSHIPSTPCEMQKTFLQQTLPENIKLVPPTGEPVHFSKTAPPIITHSSQHHSILLLSNNLSQSTCPIVPPNPSLLPATQCLGEI